MESRSVFEQGVPPAGQDPYVAWRGPLSAPAIRPDNTVLLSIDMQHLDADWDCGMCKQARQAGFETDLLYYRDRLAIIVPNIRQLQKACRSRGVELIHVKIRSLKLDGRDRGLMHKGLDMHAAPGSLEAEILDELKPEVGEIVLTKTTSSAFNGTTLDHLLRALNIKNLIVCGVFTTNCIESTVRDGADLGYSCIVVENACGALVEEMHLASIRVMRNVYARIWTAEEVVAALEAL
jgi:nicotinamidase-related amidase